MRIAFNTVNFCGQPDNYAIIDNYISRSAQPKQEDFQWLKEQGITDIFNFRTMYRPDINFDEEKIVKACGMNYHNIPSITAKPTEENVDLFFKEVGEVKQRGGKAHIHCKAGADRTGMYALIYKTLNNIKCRAVNKMEMIKMGHHFIKYPEIIPWAEKYIDKKLLFIK